MPRSGFWTLRTGGRAVPLDRSQSIRCRAALTPRMYFRGARELGRPDRRGELLDGESERVERIRQLGWFEGGRNRAQSACDEAELFPKLRVTGHVWERRRAAGLAFRVEFVACARLRHESES